MKFSSRTRIEGFSPANKHDSAFHTTALEESVSPKRAKWELKPELGS